MKKIVLGITGASGGIYPKIFLDTLKKQNNIQLAVVATANGKRVFLEENGIDLREFWPEILSNQTFDVPFVSGSNVWDAMVLMPCSMGTAGRVANGLSNDTLTRAADVFLKEKRPLIVVARETPLNLIHLRNLTQLAEAGATILPAIPSFYGGQKTIDDIAATVVSRVLDHLQIPNSLLKRWQTSYDKGQFS